jgi:hypothetical protein
VILDAPCAEVVERKTAEYTAMFTPGAKFLSGLSMLTVDTVRDGKVYSHNKGGKLFEETIFRAGSTYTPGWEKPVKEEKQADATAPIATGLAPVDNTPSTANDGANSEPGNVVAPPAFPFKIKATNMLADGTALPDLTVTDLRADNEQRIADDTPVKGIAGLEAFLRTIRRGGTP